MPVKDKPTKSPKIDLTISPPSPPEVEPSSADGSPGAVPPDVEAEVVNAPQVDEAVVRTLLKAFSGVTSYAVGRDDVVDHWKFTNQELDDLTPPLTRYINRRPKLRAAVARGDEAAIGMVLASYTGRNIAAGQTARKAEEKARSEKLQREADESARTSSASSDASNSGQSPYGGNGGIVHSAVGG